MKKIIILILIFLLSINIIKTEATMLEMPLIGKIIYLDAGHGGIDPGATYKDINEKDIALAITLKLEEALSKKGAIVYLTRRTDTDLADVNATYRKRSDLGKRAKLINESDCELYLSLHLNSYPSTKWAGAQVFFTTKNDSNKIIAEFIQNELKEKMNTNREFKEIKNMYMYDRISKPGVLIEVGFLSNTNDRNNLLNEKYQEKLVMAITDGVIKYLHQF